MSDPLTLDLDTVEAIACRVAELLDEDRYMNGLVDAAEIANRFSISRDYVYEHATELGAIRLGSGPRARLRFDPQAVVEALSPRPAPATDPHPHPRRSPRSRSGEVELLPIGRRT